MGWVTTKGSLMVTIGSLARSEEIKLFIAVVPILFINSTVRL